MCAVLQWKFRYSRHGVFRAYYPRLTLCLSNRVDEEDGMVNGPAARLRGAQVLVTGAALIDGAGATIVPGMVDSHAHLSMPGGADWITRAFDPLDTLLAVGEENGELLV